MVFDELGKQLHDCATRGEVLSVKEQAQLNAWYEEQDRATNSLLHKQRAAP